MSLIDLFAPRLAVKVEGRKVALLDEWPERTPESIKANARARRRRYALKLRARRKA